MFKDFSILQHICNSNEFVRCKTYREWSKNPWRTTFTRVFLFQDLINQNLIFPYGYFAGYGLGFAGPYLLPTYIGSCSFDCSAADFSAVVDKYGFRQGAAGLNIGESKLSIFGLDAKQALRNVVTDYTEQNQKYFSKIFQQQFKMFLNVSNVHFDREMWGWV